MRRAVSDQQDLGAMRAKLAEQWSDDRLQAADRRAVARSSGDERRCGRLSRLGQTAWGQLASGPGASPKV
jgi:hypothetical protein